VLVGSTGAEQLIKAVINSSTAQILQLLLELQHWSWSWSQGILKQSNKKV
jgi:hypothetical protein